MAYTIRRLQPTDAAALFRLRQSPGVVRNTLQQPFQSLAATQAFLDHYPETSHALVACTESGELVGCGGLHLPGHSLRRRHSALFFLFVRDDWQGKGVGSALLRAVLDYADNWLDLKRIELDAVHDNHGAIALYERFGFRHEGVSRGFNLREGVYEDAVLMARLRFREGELGEPLDISSNQTVEHVPAGSPFSLRHAEPGDAAGMAALMAHDSTYGNTLQLPYPTTANWQKRLAKHGGTVLVACDASGTLIGHCGAWAPHDNPRLAHIVGVGITVTPAWQGRGVGSALLSAMVQQVRDYQPYRRMELTAFAGNAAAMALYRKLGFQQEAVLAGYAYQAGQYRDCLQMALTLK